MALAEPVVAADGIEGFEDGLGADAVGTVGVGQVAGSVNLVGPDLAQQIDDEGDVALGKAALFDTARLVERHVEEMGVGIGVQPERTHGGAGLGAADGPLDVEQGPRLGSPLRLEAMMRSASAKRSPKPNSREVSIFCNTTSSWTATLPEVW